MTSAKRHCFFKRLRDRKGTSMVEAALMTPLMLFLTFAIVEFGAIFYVWLALQNGASQATRFAVTGNTIPGFSRQESIKKVMRDATPTLTIQDSAFSFSHMAVGGSSWVGGTGGSNELEKLTINYSWPFLTPLLKPFFPSGKVDMKVESAMKNERAPDE